MAENSSINLSHFVTTEKNAKHRLLIAKIKVVLNATLQTTELITNFIRNSF